MMKRLLLLFPIVLLTCGAGKRELVSYICEYRNDEHTAEKMIADFKEDWGKANELYVPWIFDKSNGNNYVYKSLENSFHHANSERSKENENEIYISDTGIANGVFKAITSTYETNDLTFKAVFELNMDTMSETWTVLYPDDRKDSTDKCMFISLPENSKVEWKE